MKAGLKARGFTDDDIFRMRPQDARDILADPNSNASERCDIGGIASENTRRAAHPPSSNDGEPGLSSYTIRELASWCVEEAARRVDDPDLAAVGTLQNVVDVALRRRLAELGVSPEFIGVEFERVMQVVFEV
jgi:hypothetical protein